MEYLVLVQYRKQKEYNDFIGKFYHFPKKYLSFFPDCPFEFIYYEPKKKGEGVYFGYGKISKKPIRDKRDKEYYFIEIDEYKPFQKTLKGPLEPAPFYNPQNAVRKINEDIFESICLDGNILLNFNADAHLVEVLGEQLIGSEKVGILELIKNSYDAHATECSVYIEQIDNLPEINKDLYKFPEYKGPVIVIEDNGIGMDRNIIENGWLRPASRIKTIIKEKIRRERKKALETNRLGSYDELMIQLKKAHKNRIPLGEKGVGRFAVNRLGQNLLLKTKAKNKNFEYVLEIDWNNFHSDCEQLKDLKDVGVILRKQTPSREYGKIGTGTQVIIYNGKEGFEWDRETIEELNRAILQLNSPNEKESNFKVKLICPQIPDLQKILINDDFLPSIQFSGLVDENGIMDYELKFTPPKSVPMNSKITKDNKLDLKFGEIDYWKRGDSFRMPQCGGFFIDINVWYREKPWIDGPNAKSFKDYLDAFGGLTIYRDGINVFPAEKGKENDWLGLSRRQIKQVYRISYYHMIGNIEIDQTKNFDLTDKTNREGLIQNQAYNDFKWLVKYIIENVLEKEYISNRDKYNQLTQDIVREPRLLNDFVKQGTKVVKNITSNYPFAKDPYKLLTELGDKNEREDKLINLERSLKNLQKSLTAIEESKALLTEQAGFGLAIAVSVHELAKITTNFYNGINDLLKRGYNKDKLIELREASLSIKSELKRLSPLRAIRNEKRIEFPISKAVKYVSAVFKTKLDANKIILENEIVNDFTLYSRYGAVLQIITNFFTNSIYWLKTPGLKERKIKIKSDKKNRCLFFADSGPGIHESILPYLFEAGYSMKIPASGLGLYISKYYMQDMKGDIYLTHNRERMENVQGAQFTLDFERVLEKRGE